MKNRWLTALAVTASVIVGVAAVAIIVVCALALTVSIELLTFAAELISHA